MYFMKKMGVYAKKKYCECYNVEEKCGKLCKCEGCENCWKKCWKYWLTKSLVRQKNVEIQSKFNCWPLKWGVMKKKRRAKFIGDWDYISRNLTWKIKNKFAENRLKCRSSWWDSSEMEIEEPVRNSHTDSFSLKTLLILLYFFLFFSN